MIGQSEGRGDTLTGRAVGPAWHELSAFLDGGLKEGQGWHDRVADRDKVTGQGLGTGQKQSDRTETESRDDSDRDRVTEGDGTGIDDRERGRVAGQRQYSLAGSALGLVSSAWLGWNALGAGLKNYFSGLTRYGVLKHTNLKQT